VVLFLGLVFYRSLPYGNTEQILAALFFAIVISTALVLLLVQVITRPLGEFARVVRQLAQGNWNARVKYRNQDELGEVARSLNDFSDKIRETVSALEESKARLEAILVNMESGVLLVNSSGQVVLVNPAAEETLGILLRELKGSFPEVGWWQSLFLPAAGIAAPHLNIEELRHTCETATGLCSCLPHPNIEGLRLQMQELATAGADAVILDTAVKRAGKTRFGGTGQTSNWELACSLVETSPLPVFLAGGIKPSNIKVALDAVRPDGVDLCSGVEVRPGRKDPAKLRELIDLVRIWEKENN
jgi:PAS domain-containing protein